MLTLSPEEKAYFNQVLEEFNGLTNEQAYVNIFSKRMMQPIPNRVAEYMGCDQRIDMLPSLQQLVSHLPSKGEIFDVGAGAGDVVDFALKDAPQGTLVNLEEPNTLLLNAYIEKLKKYPHLKVGLVYPGILEDFYRKTINKLPSYSQSLILAIHMIYHLTDFTQTKIQPEEDLSEAILYLYELLAPGGSLFIVYADLQDSQKSEAVCGMAEKFFRTFYPKKHFADHLQSIYQARNALLGPKGTICDLLRKRFPHSKPQYQALVRNTHFFGKYVADIAVLGLATELCPSDTKPFDLKKLQFCWEYVTTYPKRIGLQKEEGPVFQKGLWRANEPQVISIITKKT